MPCCALTAFIVLLQVASWGLAADPNDWVNVNYVVKSASNAPSDTSSSRSALGQKADSSVKNGPFTITKQEVKPPSGDIHDYYSWAPYHWPSCNWCSKGSNHFASPNSTDNSPMDGDDGSSPSNSDDDDPYYQESIQDMPGDDEYLVDGMIRFNWSNVSTYLGHPYRWTVRKRSSNQETPCSSNSLGRRDLPAPDDVPADPLAPPTDAVPLPTTLPDVTGAAPSAPTAPPSTGTSTRRAVAGTQAPAEAHAKTTHGKAACTPSPTKSLAPSATWTTCPYVVKDGKVNPDVKLLPGPSILQNMPESVLFNAVTYVLTKSQSHSQNAAKFVNSFFLASATLMHPNMNFGQLVRGPGKDHQVGTFTGILDFRAFVKVVNAVQLLKAAKSPDWSSSQEQGLTTWTKSYITWLQSSSIGKETAGKANNHLTFYVNQLAAAQMYVGDTKGATTTLSNYFKKQFLDQIAASGEQPFEAVRTRPYHYRAFNLEAMITNAKLGDQLGMNFWAAKSKYGATIQTALDYAMAQSPGKEDVDDIVPHVAAIAAAYGDPKGKYKSFLQSKASGYKSEAWYFFDQTAALPNSPAAGGKGKRADDDSNDDTDNLTPFSHVPFECPAVFDLAPEVELEVGLFVTCDDLRRFYKIAPDWAIVGDEWGLRSEQ